MAKRKSKGRTFEKIIMSMPTPDRSLILDKIFRFAVLDKKPLAEKLNTEKLITKKLAARKRRAAVKA